MKIFLPATLCFSAAVVHTQAAATVTFLHINDHHSHLEELSWDIQDTNFLPTDALGIETSNIRFFYGGFPRIVTGIKEREAAAIANGHDVIKVHAGDALTGTFYYTFFNSEVDAAVMNVVQFDAFVIGNHEFE